MKRYAKIFLIIAFIIGALYYSANAEIYKCCERIPIPPDDYNIQDETTETIEDKYSETPILQFRISNLSPDIDTNVDYTDWWYSEWEDCHYIFLPATADRNCLEINFDTENDLPVYLNDEMILSAETTDILSKSDIFSIKVGKEYYGELKIMQSDLGCIYLNTSSIGLDKLDANSYFIETGTALILNKSGGIEYNGKLEKITSHGNSSWIHSKKKSYNIKLPQKENLYGMGKAKKWALISNYIDHSMLRNTIAIEMSKNAGIEYAVDYTYIDLYADGSYRGTYQFCERIEIQKNRVNITDLEKKTENLNNRSLNEYERITIGADSPYDYIENSYKYYNIPNNPVDITGGYLLQFQLWNRYGYKAESGFVTSRGQAIDIVEPEYSSKEQVMYIRNFVQDLEDAIYSTSGYNDKKKHYSDYIDIDSLIKSYLVQEITMNIDGTFTSFYLWKDSDICGDGKLHFSPVWDFDLSYNNFPTHYYNSDGIISYSYKTDNLFVANFPIHGYNNLNEVSQDSGRSTCGISWIGQLFKQTDFSRRVAEMYFLEYDNYLLKLNKSGITEMADKIKKSAEMNNARWHTYGNGEFCVFGAFNGNNFNECVEYVRNFLDKRSQYLHDLWLPCVNYIEGDVNQDNIFNLSDIVLLQKYLLCYEKNIVNWKAGDLNGNNKLDVFDLCLMKRKFINLLN